MKFFATKPLIQHLKAKGPAPLLAIAVKEEEEKKLRSKELLDLLLSFESAEVVKMTLLEDKDLRALEEEALTVSFFHSSKIIVVYTTEKLLALKLALLTNLPKSLKMIIVADAISEKFYQPLKQHLILLDLKEEKPWVLKERLTDELLEYFHLQGKKITLPMAKEIVEKVGAEELKLKQFSENLICYIAEKEEVSLSDIFACLTDKQKIASWQLVDMLLLGEKPASFQDIDHTVDGLGLIGQMRYKIQQLLKKLAGVDENYPKVITKYVAAYEKVHPKFFSDLSTFLLNLEFTLKNGVKETGFIVDYLYANIAHLRQQHLLKGSHDR